MREPPSHRPPQADLFQRPAANTVARVLSVTELTREMKGTLESRFARVAVRGEISNFRPAASGHLYFTLKDDGACVTAVLFRTDASRLKFQLKDGLLVVARGRVTVYEARGQYQIICESLEPEGAGALALAFEQLKARLSKEGLFDAGRKRPIPFLARRIGLVTSPTGAAIRDFLRVLNDRFPIPVLLAPARVQGEGAAEELARAVARLGASGLVDVIVVTRGGGSIEDLWSFNEEVLARAIAACPVPVISAVGHEVDFTISDFVADRRCATPTDAAKTLAPPREDLARALDKHRRHLHQLALRLIGLRRERLQARLARLGDPRRRVDQQRLALDHACDRLQQSLRRAVDQRRAALKACGERLSRAHPANRLRNLSRVLHELDQRLAGVVRQRLAQEKSRLRLFERRLGSASPAPAVARHQRHLALLRERANAAATGAVSRERARFGRAATALEALSPLRVLGRGYAIAFRGEHALRAATQVAVGEQIRVMLADQSALEAQVTRTHPSPVAEPDGTGSAAARGAARRPGSEET